MSPPFLREGEGQVTVDAMLYNEGYVAASPTVFLLGSSLQALLT